jgi:phosphatidylglycerol---prolipoprotein diacylglyceryl transferase
MAPITGIPFPNISPAVFTIGGHACIGSFCLGPFSLRWYALAYITGLLLGWWLLRRLVRLFPAVATRLQVDDFLTWATLGVILGGRTGYVLFYQPAEFLNHPAEILQVWNGGMSFHGGMLGVVIALILFTRQNAIPLLGFADRLAVVTPMGLGLGRCANFINGELWGRPVEAPWVWWGIIFPHAPDALPRHPSQLYEAFAEGVLLFALLFALSRREWIRARFGFLTGTFLAGYSLARITCEFFREPDAFLGPIYHGATMGQLLSIPMLLAGAGLIAWSLRSRRLETNP